MLLQPSELGEVLKRVSEPLSIGKIATIQLNGVLGLVGGNYACILRRETSCFKNIW